MSTLQDPRSDADRLDAPLRPLCVICASRHNVMPFHLTHGLTIGLCVVHRTLTYLRRQGGAVFVRRLAEVWASNGVLSVRRRHALEGHLRRVRQALISSDLPGSYAWKPQRAHAEARFSLGVAANEVLSELRDASRWGAAQPPSRRTVLRWLADARWLSPPHSVSPTADAVARGIDAVVKMVRECGAIWRCDDPASMEIRRLAAERRRE